jgi:hypothetical protein
MIELAIFMFVSRLCNWGCGPVIASRVVAMDDATLRAAVAAPAAQWRLVGAVSPRLRPRAHVIPTRSERVVPVRISLGRHEVLRVTWVLAPARGTTEVDLVAQPQSRAILVRLALVCGVRRWLRHRLEAALETVAALALSVAEDLHDVARDADPDGVPAAVSPDRLIATRRTLPRSIMRFRAGLDSGGKPATATAIAVPDEDVTQAETRQSRVSNALVMLRERRTR